MVVFILILVDIAKVPCTEVAVTSGQGCSLGLHLSIQLSTMSSTEPTLIKATQPPVPGVIRKCSAIPEAPLRARQYDSANMPH